MTSYRYIRSRGVFCTARVSPPYSADDGESSSSDDDEDSESPISVVARSLPPHLQRLIRSPSPSPIPSPSVNRQRPRLWVQAPSPSEASAGNNDSSKRRIYANDYYESDDEDDSDSDNEEEGCIDPAQLHRPSKRPRRIYSTLTVRGTPCWLTAPRTNAVVTFSDPLVTEVRTRPRTAPEERFKLFYRKADEMKFREDYRRERRLMNAVSNRESDGDDISSSDSDDEDLTLAITHQRTNATPEEHNGSATANEATVSCKGANQVSESSSSNGEEEDSDESSTSSPSDEDEEVNVKVDERKQDNALALTA